MTGCLHSAHALEPNTVRAGCALPLAFFERILGKGALSVVAPVSESSTTHLFLEAGAAQDQPLLLAIQELCAIDETAPGRELHFLELVSRTWRLLAERLRQDGGTTKELGACRMQEQRLKRMMSFVYARYSGRITVDDMASSASISRTECFRCFQACLGMTPVQYLNDYRLTVA